MHSCTPNIPTLHLRFSIAINPHSTCACSFACDRCVKVKLQTTVVTLFATAACASMWFAVEIWSAFFAPRRQTYLSQKRNKDIIPKHATHEHRNTTHVIDDIAFKACNTQTSHIRETRKCECPSRRPWQTQHSASCRPRPPIHIRARLHASAPRADPGKRNIQLLAANALQSLFNHFPLKVLMFFLIKCIKRSCVVFVLIFLFFACFFFGNFLNYLWR